MAYLRIPTTTITSKISPHTYLYIQSRNTHTFFRGVYRRRRREVNDSRIDCAPHRLTSKESTPRQSEEQPLSRPHIGNFNPHRYWWCLAANDRHCHIRDCYTAVGVRRGKYNFVYEVFGGVKGWAESLNVIGGWK